MRSHGYYTERALYEWMAVSFPSFRPKPNLLTEGVDFSGDTERPMHHPASAGTE